MLLLAEDKAESGQFRVAGIPREATWFTTLVKRRQALCDTWLLDYVTLRTIFEVESNPRR